MFKCFVEDSGKEALDSPVFVLSSWTARVDDWERFSDAWDTSLSANNPRSLGYNKGHRYFRHHDAVTQKDCFAGFSPQEAALKTTNLAWLLVGLRVAGISVVVPHDEYREFVKNKAIIRRGKLRPEQKHPFYIAFAHLVPRIHALHYHSGFMDKIDFIFDGDKTDRALRDCIRTFGNIKYDFKDEIWYPLMGEMIPGDDKELAPLQAADMLAGQMRKSIVELGVQPLIKLWEDNQVKVHSEYIDQAKLEAWSSRFNQDLATDILTRIKDEREGRVPPRVMSGRREKKKP
jgi:hypothetical protein